MLQVFCKFQLDGLHYWPEAAGEVEYLKLPHRHVFHFECYKLVTNENRETEFISMKHLIQSYMLSYWSDDLQMCDFGKRSCEMLAIELVKKFDLCKCVVSEDGENGSVLVS